MYILISLFRIGHDKIYRKVKFYTKNEMIEYIDKCLNKNETITLLKKEERTQERDDKMNKQEYFAWLLSRCDSPEELQVTILQDRELMNKIINHAYGSEELDMTYNVFLDGYYYNMSEIKQFITSHIEDNQETFDDPIYYKEY